MPEERRIILIGKAHSGKSSSGNTILGHEIFRSNAGVQKCKLGNANNRFGKDLTVIDTPGLFNIRITNVDVLKKVTEGFRMTSPGPHAIVFVLAVGRFTQEDQDTVTLFHELCGDAMYRHMVVVFTGRDRLERDNITIQQYIDEENFPFRELLRKCDHRYIALDTTPDQPREARDYDANTFLAKVEHIRGYYSIEEMRQSKGMMKFVEMIVGCVTFIVIIYKCKKKFHMCSCVWASIEVLGSVVSKTSKKVLNSFKFWK